MIIILQFLLKVYFFIFVLLFLNNSLIQKSDKLSFLLYYSALFRLCKNAFRSSQIRSGGPVVPKIFQWVPPSPLTFFHETFTFLQTLLRGTSDYFASDLSTELKGLNNDLIMSDWPWFQSANSFAFRVITNLEFKGFILRRKCSKQ